MSESGGNEYEIGEPGVPGGTPYPASGFGTCACVSSAVPPVLKSLTTWLVAAVRDSLSLAACAVTTRVNVASAERLGVRETGPVRWELACGPSAAAGVIMSPTIAATAIKAIGTATLRPMRSLSLVMSFKNINLGPLSALQQEQATEDPHPHEVDEVPVVADRLEDVHLARVA
jgi:hypothetical protein